MFATTTPSSVGGVVPVPYIVVGPAMRPALPPTSMRVKVTAGSVERMVFMVRGPGTFARCGVSKLNLCDGDCRSRTPAPETVISCSKSATFISASRGVVTPTETGTAMCFTVWNPARENTSVYWFGGRPVNR